MPGSPSISAKLYRKGWCIVIFAATILAWVHFAASQSKKAPREPRALALVELAANGKAHLIPIAILVDGQFYDASAYKAAPVPMALESGTVYEAERAGTSVGLFTVRGALHGSNNTWMGDGAWLPAGAKPPNAKHQAEDKPRDLEPQDAPPVLRRSSPEKPKTPVAAPSEPAAATPPVPSAPPATSIPAPAAPSATAPPSVPSDPNPAEEDSNHPVLRRNPSNARQQVIPDLTVPVRDKHAAVALGNSKMAKNPNGPVQTLAAISDANGTESHTYLYPVKAVDETALRKKMLVLAEAEINVRMKQQTNAIGEHAPATVSKSKTARSAKTSAAKPPQPNFENVEFHVLDLSSNNEPVLVLTAAVNLPPGKTADVSNPQYLIAIVARQDIYGGMRKVFSSITDSQHLDVTPSYEFIDAVDADGDGRGELLFRRASNDSSAYSVYRVIGQQLWPLFEGALTP